MRHNRLIAAVAGAAFASAALVGCSSDDLDKAAQDAKNKGSEALSDAASKGADAASDAADKAGAGSGDASGDAQGGEAGTAGGSSATVDLGEFSDDPNAKAVAQFFTLRYEAASGAGDVSALEPITTPARYKSVQGYVQKNQGLTGGVTVNVVGVEGDAIDVCAGEGEVKPFTFTVVDGKVGPHVKGDHTC